MFEEKGKEKEKPKGLPPKKSLADLPWKQAAITVAEYQPPLVACVHECCVYECCVYMHVPTQYHDFTVQ